MVEQFSRQPNSSKQRGSEYRERHISQQRYSVVCWCGETVRGVRTAASQEMICRECGACLFLLPVDVYPLVEIDPLVEELIELDEPVDLVFPDDERKPFSGNETSAGKKTSSEKKSHSEKGTANEDRRSAVLISRLRRLVTPLRLLIFTILIALSLTGYWSIRQNRVESAERNFKHHADSGLAFIHEKKFVEAVRELELAVEALELLDRDDEKTREVRQMLREAKAISDLSSKSFVAMATDFEQAAAAGDSRWEDRFRTMFKNQWLVLEIPRPFIDGEDVLFDVPLVVGNATIELRGRLDIFEQAARSGKELPTLFVVAVQLESCHREVGSSPVWVVRVRSDSAFLWANASNLKAIGFSLEAETEAEAKVDSTASSATSEKQSTRQALILQSEIIDWRP